MSICAHESFMSMLMKLSRARAREGVTRTTTIGQYAAGLYKLGTTQGVLLGVYSRNQFEPLPEPLLSITQVNKDTEIPLRTAANKQSQGGGQGFIRCGCSRTCQANNCKCKKNNHFCNSRCHKASKMCLNHE